jgi:hypothetical protein
VTGSFAYRAAPRRRDSLRWRWYHHRRLLWGTKGVFTPRPTTSPVVGAGLGMTKPTSMWHRRRGTVTARSRARSATLRMPSPQSFRRWRATQALSGFHAGKRRTVRGTPRPRRGLRHGSPPPPDVACLAAAWRSRRANARRGANPAPGKNASGSYAHYADGSVLDVSQPRSPRLRAT